MELNRVSPSVSRKGPEKSIAALLARQDSAQIFSIWRNERICEYLLACDSRRHTWHAWLAVRGTAILDAPETYRFFTFAKSKQILTDAFGECPAGMTSVLGKFGPFARQKHAYFALHRVLSGGGALAEHICQSPKIDDDDLISLASAAGLVVSNRIIHALLKRKLPAQVMIELLWVISRLAPMHDERQLVRCINEGRQPGVILANLFGLTPFPAPPFEQIGALIPITTAEQLRKTGEEFGNCLKAGEELAYALASVHTGYRYFYRWNGDHPTLLALCRCGPTGWILAECSGRKNARVPETTMDKIGEVLADIPSVFTGKEGAGMLKWICAR